MDALVPALKSHPGPSVLVFALFFRLIHRLLTRLPAPKVVEQNEHSHWKWSNLSVSMVHSLLTGTWAVTCAWIWPETLSNLTSFHTQSSYLLICISAGYFVHDASDIILSGRGRESWEFMLHHTLVISCFMYTLYTGLYVAGGVVALFVEVNSITLHLRLMLKLASAQYSSLYYYNKFANIITYVIFRLGAQFYLTQYIIANYSRLANGAFFLVCIMMMNIMMLIYFYRLLRSDFITRHRPVGQNGTHNNNSKKFLTD